MTYKHAQYGDNPIEGARGGFSLHMTTCGSCDSLDHLWQLWQLGPSILKFAKSKYKSLVFIHYNICMCCAILLMTEHWRKRIQNVDKTIPESFVRMLPTEKLDGSAVGFNLTKKTFLLQSTLSTLIPLNIIIARNVLDLFRCRFVQWSRTCVEYCREKGELSI